MLAGRLSRALQRLQPHALSASHSHRAQIRGQRGVRRCSGGAAAGAAPGSRTAGRQGAPVTAVHGASQEAHSSAADRAAAVMEVEVKLRLAGADAHAKLAAALQPSYKTTHQQENYFFDGAQQELSSRRVVLRVRFYNGDAKAVITVKGKQVLQDGIGRAPEEEEPVDPADARAFLAEPARLLNLGTPLLESLKSSTGVQQLVCLGGFNNTRQEFEWQGHLLELDETKYEWGTLYELECETPEPEKLRAELEAYLSQLGVGYKYSTTTKFANFRNRTLE